MALSCSLKCHSLKLYITVMLSIEAHRYYNPWLKKKKGVLLPEIRNKARMPNFITCTNIVQGIANSIQNKVIVIRKK